MHDLLIVITTLLIFIPLTYTVRWYYEVLDNHQRRRYLRALKRDINTVPIVNDNKLIAFVLAELRTRLSMTGEYNVTTEQSLILRIIANEILTLAILRLKNQIDLLSLLVSRINDEEGYFARINFTTNNRAELIIQHRSTDQLLYIKFHSINTLF